MEVFFQVIIKTVIKVVNVNVDSIVSAGFGMARLPDILMVDEVKKGHVIFTVAREVAFRDI